MGVVRGTYLLPVYAFLVRCGVAEAPKSQSRPIRTRYETLIEGWQLKMDVDFWFRSAMVSAGQRVSQGEDPELVLQELRKRFDEQYGEVGCTAGGDTPPNDATV